MHTLSHTEQKASLAVANSRQIHKYTQRQTQPAALWFRNKHRTETKSAWLTSRLDISK